MTPTDTEAITEAYAEQREHDWNAFVTGSGPLNDFWGRWEERSFGWRVPIEFLQPLGLESPVPFLRVMNRAICHHETPASAARRSMRVLMVSTAEPPSSAIYNCSSAANPV